MGLFCALTKSFDSVSHKLLILKLGFYEVKGSKFNRSKYYLHNRKQSVVYCNLSVHLIFYQTGKYRHVVPQGSVLGLLLFNVYINDFPYIINEVSHTILFADDTNILDYSSDLNELISKLNSVLCCISKWFQNNQLALNLNKTQTVKLASSKLLTYQLHIA